MPEPTVKADPKVKVEAKTEAAPKVRVIFNEGLATHKAAYQPGRTYTIPQVEAERYIAAGIAYEEVAAAK